MRDKIHGQKYQRKKEKYYRNIFFQIIVTQKKKVVGF